MPGSILSDVLTQYESATAGWFSALFPLAQKLFFVLVALELTWAGIWWALEREDGNQVLVELLRKVLTVSFFYALLINANTWLPAIIRSFTAAGRTASRLPDLNPSTVLDQGISLAANIVRPLGLTGLIGNPFVAMFGAIAALIVVVAFAIIAAQLLITLVESYIVIGGGVFLLGFAGSRWTKFFAERYLSYAAGVGVKLFTLYLIMGVGAGITDQWGRLLAADLVGPHILLEVIGGAVLFVFLVWSIPTTAGAMMGNAVSLSFADAVVPALLGARAAGAAMRGGGAAAAYLAATVGRGNNGGGGASTMDAASAARMHATVSSGPGAASSTTSPYDSAGSSGAVSGAAEAAGAAGTRSAGPSMSSDPRTAQTSAKGFAGTAQTAGAAPAPGSGSAHSGAPPGAESRKGAEPTPAPNQPLPL